MALATAEPSGSGSIGSTTSTTAPLPMAAPAPPQPLRLPRRMFARHGSSSSIGSSGPSPLGSHMQLYDDADELSGLSMDEGTTINHGGPLRSSSKAPRMMGLGGMGVAQYLARGLSLSSTDFDGPTADEDDDDDDFDFEAKLRAIRPVSEDGSPPEFGSSISSFEFLKSASNISASTTSSSDPDRDREKDPTTPRPGQAPPPRTASTVRRIPHTESGWRFPRREDSANIPPPTPYAMTPARNGSFASVSVTSGGSSSRPTSPNRFRAGIPSGVSRGTFARSFSEDADAKPAVAVGAFDSSPEAPLSAPSVASAARMSERSASPPPAPISAKALLAHVHAMKLEAMSRKAAAPPTRSANSSTPQLASLLGVANGSSSGLRDRQDSLRGWSASRHQRSESENSGASDELGYARHERPGGFHHNTQSSIASLASTVEENDGSPALGSTADSQSSQMMGVETLDLSHQRIAELGLPVVQELAEFVERLALGYNYLPVLPSHFSLLGENLRYLNLRGNHMEIFPEVLTRMPSIEILDVSRNKIRAMPKRPGTLDRLRVFSISRNRIRRLPNYFATLTSLRVLKMDHNPIVWPPRDVTTFIEAPSPREVAASEGGSDASSVAMATWLKSMQEWMRKNPYTRPTTQGSARRFYAGDDSDARWDEDGADRGIYTHRKLDSLEESPTIPQSAPRSPLPPSPRPPSRSPLFSESPGKHVRNASATLETPEIRKRPELRLKKSLPDLRRNHGEIMVERRAEIDGFRPFMGGSQRSPLPPLDSTMRAPSMTSSSSAMAPSTTSSSVSNGSPEQRKTPGLPTSGSVRFNELQVAGHERDTARRKAADEQLQGDRNSGAYFRRLSMLPASTISKRVPEPLLKLVDAIRGILFSLSQIYAALKQFVVFASYDRLPGAISRVMSSADESMGRLIDSLDRFDSRTRRGSPDAEVVRQLFETCRENVSVFGTLASVLSIQLKVLVGPADVRYSRTLLLNLYGSSVEISLAWAAITPLVPAVAQILFPEKQLEAAVRLLPPTPAAVAPGPGPAKQPQSTSTLGAPLTTTRAGPMSPSGRPKARRHAGSFSVEDVRTGASMPMVSASLNHGGMTAANAPEMPSPPPSMAAIMRQQADTVVPSAATSRLAGRLARNGLPSSLGLQPPVMADILAAQNMPPSPFGAAPSFGPPGPLSAQGPKVPTPAPRSALPTHSRSTTPTHVVPAPGSSRTDQDFLDMAEATTNIAVSVSTMLLETLGRAVGEAGKRYGTPNAAFNKARELLELCETELEATRKLRLSLTRVRGLGGDGSGARERTATISALDARRVYEDSTMFVKMIIQMGGLAKAAMPDYPLPKSIREGLGQLTKATKELATLLAVSSFKPGAQAAAIQGLGVTHVNGL